MEDKLHRRRPEAVSQVRTQAMATGELMGPEVGKGMERTDMRDIWEAESAARAVVVTPAAAISL